MYFIASEIEKITDVKGTRLKEWPIQPSITEAKGHGTLNIYSREDVYKIATFKALIESGLSRKLAGSFIKTIEPAALKVLTDLGMHSDYSKLIEDIRNDKVPEEIYPKIIPPDSPFYSDNPDSLKQDVLSYLEGLLNSVLELYLIFICYTPEDMIDCIPVVSGDFASKLQMPVKDGDVTLYGWGDIGFLFAGRDYGHVLNIGMIMNQVNKSIYENYPEKMSGVQWYPEEIAAILQPPDSKVSKSDKMKRKQRKK